MKYVITIALLFAPAFSVKLRQYADSYDSNDSYGDDHKVYGMGWGHCFARGKGH